MKSHIHPIPRSRDQFILKPKLVLLLIVPLKLVYIHTFPHLSTRIIFRPFSANWSTKSAAQLKSFSGMSSSHSPSSAGTLPISAPSSSYSSASSGPSPSASARASSESANEARKVLDPRDPDHPCPLERAEIVQYIIQVVVVFWPFFVRICISPRPGPPVPFLASSAGRNSGMLYFSRMLG